MPDSEVDCSNKYLPLKAHGVVFPDHKKYVPPFILKESHKG